MTTPPDFEKLMTNQGVRLPPGQELAFIASSLSETNLFLEHLHTIGQGLVDHLAMLTERLLVLQTEIRTGMRENREAVKDLAAQLLVLQHTVKAIQQKAGVLPLPPE